MKKTSTSHRNKTFPAQTNFQQRLEKRNHPILKTDRKLAKHIGDKLKTIRTGRKLTKQEVAKQLGIGRDYYADIERGKVIPAAEVQRRLLHWATENMTFEGAESLRSAASVHRHGWKKYVLYVPPETRAKLKQAAADCHLSANAWIHIAIERLLKYPNFTLMMKDAVHEIERARLTQLLERYPDLVAITKIEEEYAIAMGLNKPKPEAKEVRPDLDPRPIRQLAALPVKDGAADRVTYQRFVDIEDDFDPT